MKSIDGDLEFGAGINVDEFNADAKAIEKRTEQMAENVESESERMEDAIRDFANNGADAIKGILIGTGFTALLSSIVSTRGEFQQLEIAFETMLGSAERSTRLMNQLVDTAARTPFDLKGVADGAKQLLAYGIAAEDVNSTLVHLGDIAAGLSIPLNNLVYLYGTTMTQGRMFTQDLHQFMGRGIPLAEELAKQFGVAKSEVGELVTAGKVGAEEFNKAIMSISSEGGKFYNLMEKQSASLTGQISNLQDAWDVAKNDIGKSMEGLASTAIGAATTVVENLVPIIDIVKRIAVVYGSWKAATIMMNVLNKEATGVALLDNLAKKAKVALLQMERNAIAKNTAAMSANLAVQKKSLNIAKLFNRGIKLVTLSFKNLTRAMMANPFGLAAAAIAGLIALFSKLRSKQEEAAESARALQAEERALYENASKAKSELAVQASEIKKIIDAHGEEGSKVAELNAKYGDVFGKYNTLAQWYDVITQKAADYVEILFLQAKAERGVEEMADLDQQLQDTKAKNPREFKLSWKDYWKGKKRYEIKDEEVSKLEGAVEAKRKEVVALQEEISRISKDSGITMPDTNSNTNAENLSKEELAALERRQKALKDYNDAAQERLAEMMLEDAKTMVDGVEKQIKLVEAAYQKEIASVQKEERELKKKREEAGLGNTLSPEEQKMFSDKRTNAQRNRDESLISATEKEVSRMKTAYESFYDWADTMGVESAKERFASVVDTTKSYEEWLNSEIAKYESITDRKASDNAYLKSLYNASNEYNGKKSSLQLFNEETQEMLDNAPSLESKLSVITQRLEDIRTVAGSDIEKNNIILSLRQQAEDTSKEIHHSFEQTYKDYAKVRSEIEGKYLSDIRKLHEQGKDFIASQVEQKMKQELREVDTNFIKNLFSDVFSGKSNTKSIKDAINQLKRIKTMSLGEFNVSYNQNITEEQLKALKGRIDDVTDSIKQMGQYSYTIADAFKDIRDGRIEGNLEKVARGTDHVKDVFSQFSQVVASLSSALTELAEVSENDFLKDTAKTVAGVSNVLESAASWASMGASIGGGWGALIGGVLGGGISAIKEIMSSNAKAQQALADSVKESSDKLSASIDSMASAISSLAGTITSLDYKNFAKSTLDLLNQYNTDKATGMHSGPDLWNYVKNILRENKSASNPFGSSILDSSKLDDLFYREEATRMGDIWSDVADYINWVGSQIDEQADAAIAELQRLYESGSTNSLEYFNAQQNLLKALIELYKLYYDLSLNDEERDKWRTKIKETELALTDGVENMVTALYGTDINGIVNDWIDILGQLGSNVDLAFAKINKSVDQMVYNMIRQMLIIEPILAEVKSAIDSIDTDGDGQLSYEELLNGADILKGIKRQVKEIYDNGIAAINEAGLSSTDFALGDNTLTGSSQNVSEETAGIIAGRLNAVIINQAESTSVLRQSLVAQIEMKNHLANIESDVRTIRQRVEHPNRNNPMLSFGITE
ncbi:MAG: hypothetical protein KBT28_04660 [Bacteroidales bacterium]|nr:hypothetical protein [Candidatus Colimorpha merdihippi]